MTDAGAIIEIARIIRTFAGQLGGVEELLGQPHGAVEVVVIPGAHGKVQLADEFRAERLPVALQNVVEVVVLLPILGYMVIDRAGLRVEDQLRVAVLAHRAVNRLPDIELLRRAAPAAEHEFKADGIVHIG